MISNLDTTASVFPLRLTPFEQLMLADDRPAYPMTFFIEIAVSGNLKRTEFESAFQSSLNRHPLLIAVIKRSWLRKEWVPAASHPKVRWNDGFPSQTSTSSRCSLDLKQSPGLRTWVDHEASGSRILFQFHHAATDGIGAIQFIGDLLAHYGRATTTDQAERPSLEPVDSHRLKIRGNPWETSKKPPRLIRRWLFRLFEVLSVHPTPIRRRTAARNLSTQTSQPLFRTQFLERAEVKMLSAAAKEYGVTLNELLSLAMFKTLHAWNVKHSRKLDRDSYRIGLPASTRTPDHDDSPAANIVSYIFLTRHGHQIDDTQAMLDFIAAESRQVLNGRETGLVLLSIEAGNFIPGVMRLLCRLPVCIATTVLANVGDVKRQLRNRFPIRKGKCVAGNVTLEHLLGAAPVRPGTHVATSVGKYAGRLIVNMNCDPLLFTSTEADEFAATFLQKTRALADVVT